MSTDLLALVVGSSRIQIAVEVHLVAISVCFDVVFAYSVSTADSSKGGRINAALKSYGIHETQRHGIIGRVGVNAALSVQRNGIHTQRNCRSGNFHFNGLCMVVIVSDGDGDLTH